MPCDCTIWPFQPDPPCFRICVAALLSDVSAEELQLVLGVPDEIARSVAKVGKGGKRATLDAYREALTPSDMELLENKIRSLHGTQVKYLMNPPESRRDIITNLKKNVVDLD